jgi:hypothetical protein
MEKPVGTFEASAPGILPLANHLKRSLVPVYGEIEQALGLQLRSEMAKFL